eukprot:1969062-Rhodomonas_salina.1
MTSDALSKVTYVPGSVIFAESSVDEWRVFFGEGDSVSDHRTLVRKCAPLKAQNETFSFIHKSVQEFYVAMSIRDAVVSLVRETLMSSSVLTALFRQLASKDSKEERQPTARPKQEQQTSVLGRSDSKVLFSGEDDESTPQTSSTPRNAPELSRMASMSVKSVKEPSSMGTAAAEASDDRMLLYIYQSLAALGSKSAAANAAERRRQAKAVLRLINGLLASALHFMDL